MKYWPLFDREQAALVFGPLQPRHLSLVGSNAVLGQSSRVWRDEIRWATILDVPKDIAPYLINSFTKRPTHSIYLNLCMKEPLLKALTSVRDRGLLGELRSFDGCLNVRDVRGKPGVFSWHSYGLAIDLNAAQNPMGSLGNFSGEFLRCFSEVGFIWGGQFSRRDPMHFQWGLG